MDVTRILAVSDEVDEGLFGDKLRNLRPDLVLSCGDLPFDYLENLVSRADVPLLYVPGNHDPDLSEGDPLWSPLRFEAPVPGPPGCDNIDGRVFFWPLSSLPSFEPRPGHVVSHSISKRALNLPSYHDLDEGGMDRVIRLIHCTLRHDH